MSESAVGKGRGVAGAVALALGIGFAAMWGFWGAIEAFHEGWFAPTLGERLVGLAAYLTPCAILTTFAVVALWRPKIGGALYLLFVLGIMTWIGTTSHGDRRQIVHWLIFMTPVVLIGVLFLLGRTKCSRPLFALTAGVPILTAIVSGAGPAWRVAHRIDDGLRGARVLKGNGVELEWAPQGPGWPRHTTVTVEQAADICSRLTDDGLHLADKPLHIWRLPTVEEAVRSMAYHGVNCGGRWDPVLLRATYETTPDKETPLWDPSSEVVYWWTSSVSSRDQALIIVYHGGVFARPKGIRNPSHGFRAVRKAAKGKDGQVGKGRQE